MTDLELQQQQQNNNKTTTKQKKPNPKTPQKLSKESFCSLIWENHFYVFSKKKKKKLDLQYLVNLKLSV